MTEIISQSAKILEAKGGGTFGIKKKRTFLQNFFKKKPREKSSSNFSSSENGGKYSDNTKADSISTANSAPNLFFSKNYQAPLPPLSSQINQQSNRRGSHSSNSEVSLQISAEETPKQRNQSSTTNIASSIALSSSNSEAGVDVEVDSIMRAETRRDVIYRYNQSIKTANCGESDRRDTSSETIQNMSFKEEYSSPSVQVERLSNFNLRPSTRLTPISGMSFSSSLSPTSSSGYSVFAVTEDLGDSKEYSLPVMDASIVHDTEFHYRQISAHSKAGSLNEEYLKLMKMFNQWEALTLDTSNLKQAECTLFQKLLINQHKVVYELWEKEWEVRSRAPSSCHKPDTSSLRSTCSGSHRKPISIDTKSPFVSSVPQSNPPNGLSLTKSVHLPISPLQKGSSNVWLARKENPRSPKSSSIDKRTQSSVEWPPISEVDNNTPRRRFSDVKKDVQQRCSAGKHSPKLSPNKWSNNSTVLNLPISSPKPEPKFSSLVNNPAFQNPQCPKESFKSPNDTKDFTLAAGSSVEVKGNGGVNATIQLLQQRFNSDHTQKFYPCNSLKYRLAENSQSPTVSITSFTKENNIECDTKKLANINPTTHFSQNNTKNILELQKEEEPKKPDLLKHVDKSAEKCGGDEDQILDKVCTF